MHCHRPNIVPRFGQIVESVIVFVSQDAADRREALMNRKVMIKLDKLEQISAGVTADRT